MVKELTSAQVTDEVPGEPPKKKRKIMLSDSSSSEQKNKKSKKTLLKQEIIETYNQNFPEEERIHSVNSLDLYKLYKTYLTTPHGKRCGVEDIVFKKVANDLIKVILRKTNVKRESTSKVEVSVPPLNTEDQYILACARVFVEKNCRDNETGRLVIPLLAFEMLPEEVKSEVYLILKAQGVQDLYELERVMYVPKAFRVLHKCSEELIRNGISSVNFTCDVNNFK